MLALHYVVEYLNVSPPLSTADNTARVSNVVDMANRHSLEFVIALGAIADADAVFTTLVEDSPDNVTFTPVEDKNLLGLETAASFQFDSDNGIRNIGYKGAKRYVRLTVTPANNTGALLMGVIAILFKRKQP